MPGLHICEAGSKVFKLRTQEVIYIKLLEFQVDFFEVECAVISSQLNISLDFGLLLKAKYGHFAVKTWFTTKSTKVTKKPQTHYFNFFFVYFVV